VGTGDLRWGITEAVLSPDQALVVASGTGCNVLIAAIDFTNFDVLTPYSVSACPDGEHMYAVAYSPPRDLFATAGVYSDLRTWDAKTNLILRNLNETNSIYSLAFSPNGTSIASAGFVYGPDPQAPTTTIAREVVRIWNADTGQVKESLYAPPNRNTISSVAYSPDGSMVAAGFGDASIAVWVLDPEPTLLHSVKLRTFECFSHCPFPDTRIAFSPDGRLLAAGTNDPTAPFVFLFDVESGAFQEILGLGTIVKVWDEAAQQLYEVYDLPYEVKSMAFSPDSSLIAIAAGNRLLLKRVDTGEQLLSIPFPFENPLVGVAFSSDSRMLMYANTDGTLGILAIPSG
jgi:WD40 repeat protein